MHQSDYIEGKVTYAVISKMKQKLGWKFLINPSFLRSNFFSKCSKKFSIGYMIMFKVCRRCLQRCSLRWKKNYERTIHASKYIQKIYGWSLDAGLCASRDFFPKCKVPHRSPLQKGSLWTCPFSWYSITTWLPGGVRPGMQLIFLFLLNNIN